LPKGNELRTPAGRLFFEEIPMPNPVKPFLSIPQQMEHLKAAGMHIEDETAAAGILERVSYYRLINAYALGLYADKGKHHFREGVTFWQVYSLYAFDNRLRHVTSELLEEFEVLFRTRLANYIGEHYGPLGYTKSAMFVNAAYHRDMLDTLMREKGAQGKSPIVWHHAAKYGGDMPIWAAAEILSFGTVVKLYNNMQNTDKAAIAKAFGVPHHYLYSWLRAFVEVRNICAHYGRLYDKQLLFPPRLPKGCAIRQNMIFAVLYLLQPYVEPSAWLSSVVRLTEAVRRYPSVELERIGFPDDWQELLA